jgi:HSP20 family protein
MELIRYEQPTMLQSIFDDLFTGPFSLLDRDVSALTYPRVDIMEEKEGYAIKADLPGLAKEDIDVKVENNVLTIRGTKKHEVEKEEKGRYYHLERSYGEFTRSFNLPDNIDTNDVKANLQNGVLHIALRKTEAAKPRAIVVKV